TISNTNPDGLMMTAPNDVVTVEGAATFTTVTNHGSADSQGQFTAGLLRLRGGFTQTRNGALASQKSFVSTGTRVVCDGEGSQSIAFSNPSVSFSRFHDLSIENISLATVFLNSPVVLTGQLQSPPGVTSTLVGNGNTLTVNGGLDVDGLILDNVAITVNNGDIDQFDNVTFQNYAPTANQFTINHPALDVIFVGLNFLVAPTSGHYIVANDTNGPATPAMLTIANAQPADGSANTTTSGGFVVIWTIQFVAIDDEATTLEDTPVTIAVLANDQDPDQDALTITGVTQGAHGTVAIDPGDITVTYTPSLDFHGTDSFTYTALSSRNSDDAIVTVLVESDLEPAIAVDPESLAFGRITVGQTVSRFLTVANEGADHLHVSDINDPFFVVSDTAFTVAPGNAHMVEIGFMPETTDLIEDELSILSNDPLNPTFTVILSGIGIPRGDLNRSGDLNIVDIIALVRILLGQSPAPAPESEPRALADVNEDGDINILDIVTLVNVILGPPPGKPAVAGVGAPALIYLGEIQGRENKQQVVPVEVDFGDAVAGIQLTLAYDPAALHIGEPEPTDQIAGMTFESDNTGGTLRILVYSTEGRSIRPGAGALFYLPVTLQSDVRNEGMVRLSHAVVADVRANPVSTTVTNDRVHIAPLPTVFALKSNRPNPFNPNTTIAYEVPQQAHVRLIVYNILGQEVARLVDGVKQPGRYTMIWHGRNRNGHGVASGVYLYRMTTNAGFTNTQRMTLLK
ncbi:MAG: cadherin-like domain-containing protein, partial [Candidatus Latescibacteria bacterium]|nr:cadherin-like domain-containing protein [Candidatus Latescibacterota bacterium]